MKVNQHKKVVGQARVLSSDQEMAVLAFLEKHSKHSIRDACMFLLTSKAGLRAIEVALIEWGMIYDADGNLNSHIILPPHVTKGGRSELTRAGKQRKPPKHRVIPMHKLLKKYLMEHQKLMSPYIRHDHRLFYSERGYKFTRHSVASFFWRLYGRLGFYKCSSHSGRRTFITNAARKLAKAGASLKDIQDIVGHASLATTQLYIQVNEQAKRRLVDLI